MGAIMIYEFLEPDDDFDYDDYNEIYRPEEDVDEEEACDIASYNYECRVYGEPERRIHWRS